MDKICICVFSGTGNTLKCAEFLKDELPLYGIDTELIDITKGERPAPDSALVICYPIHGFNAPYAVERFCRKLPEAKKRVWFLKTSGEPSPLNDSSSFRLRSIVRKRKYRAKGEFHIIMPYNMVFRHSDEMASLMWKEAKRRLRLAAGVIASGKGSFPDAAFTSKLMSFICRIEHPFYPVNGRLFHVDKNKCTLCGTCERDCPAGNIKITDGRVRFGGHCGECARCSFNCPSDAIHIGIIDFMRVNGPYDFNRNPEEAEIGKFCRKSYMRYFRIKQ